jgi:hydroxymethylglutaryl-CoA lyase
MSLTDAFRHVEVAPRDGLQNEETVLEVDAKVELINRLAETGITDIEIGSFVHPKWVPQMANTAEVFQALPDRDDVNYWALVPNRTGFENAVEAGVENIATFLSASESHNQNNINRSISESLEASRAILEEADRRGMSVRSYVSTAFGCPFEGDVDFDVVLELSANLLEAGADIVSLGDTIGAGTPLQVRRHIRQVLEHFAPEDIALHLHDTQGLALTNAFVAWEEGIRQFDSSVGGLGGCPYAPGAAGNVGTEDLIHLFESMGAKTEINLDSILDVTGWIDRETEFDIKSRYYEYAGN